jgi:hypothetical protein
MKKWINSRKRLFLLIVLPVIAVVVIVVAAEIYTYYEWMPAFIQLARMPLGAENSTTFGGDAAGFTDSDFVQFPSLKKRMSIADDIYLSEKGGVATVYPPDEEAKQLAERRNGTVFIYYYKVAADGEKQREKAYSIDISTAGYKPSFLEKLFQGEYAGRFTTGLHVPS